MGEGKIRALQVTPVYPLGEKDATEDEEDINDPELGFYAVDCVGLIGDWLRRRSQGSRAFGSMFFPEFWNHGCIGPVDSSGDTSFIFYGDSVLFVSRGRGSDSGSIG